jgi:uncharacterized membrane protein
MNKMNRFKTAIGGFAAGAAWMYFADPNRGKRRRAVVRDKAMAGWRDVENEVDKARKDIANRSRGLVSGMPFGRRSGENGGSVLVDRVRSKIGRAVSHPHAIVATADEGGRVTLSGPVLEHEAEYLLKCVGSVPGVRQVENRLEVHAEPGNVSSLQGGVERRQCNEFAQENWTPALRVGAGALGGSAVLGALRRGGLVGAVGALGGTVLLARSIANRGFRDLLGVGDGAGAIHVDKTVHIDAPVEEVYNFWSNFENFPLFMTHLKEVRNLGNGRSRWVAAGPAGVSVPWEAEITQQEKNSVLAWKSLPGSVICSMGSVRFDREVEGGTRVTIRMSYTPPAGVFGHMVASLFGVDPKREIDEDMVQLKSLIETGKTRAHGNVVTRQEVGITSSEM